MNAQLRPQFAGRRLLCVGDMFIWVVPNAGNPQKVQRYPLEWARALRAMAALDAEVMLPGHGHRSWVATASDRRSARPPSCWSRSTTRRWPS